MHTYKVSLLSTSNQLYVLYCCFQQQRHNRVNLEIPHSIVYLSLTIPALPAVLADSRQRVYTTRRPMPREYYRHGVQGDRKVERHMVYRLVFNTTHLFCINRIS